MLQEEDSIIVVSLSTRWGKIRRILEKFSWLENKDLLPILGKVLGGGLLFFILSQSSLFWFYIYNIPSIVTTVTN